MKANRNSILRDEDAVSPVIAVILMVAITVVLAATVFVLVSDIGQNAGKAPVNVGFDVSETDDNLTVTSAPNADWQQLQIRSNTAALKFFLNNDASGTGNTTMTTAETWYDIKATSDIVDPSDYLNFCKDGGASNVKISIQDKEARSALGSWDLTSVASC